MSAHTPGPWAKADRLNGPWWHISSGHSVGGRPCKGGRQAIACVHGESKRGAKAYAQMFEANARLIAAAPDLLSTLQTILAEVAGPGKPDSTDSYLPPHIVDMARAVVTKATRA